MNIFDLIKIILWLAFFGSAFLLTVVVLLQESKGGGLAEAFGGTGGETFGVRAGGVNRFTFIIAAVFILSAVFIHPVTRWSRDLAGAKSLPDNEQQQPGPGAPGGPGGGPR